MSTSDALTKSGVSTTQFTTFYVDNSLFGIEVMKVQEVTGRPVLIEVPLAPACISGLVNLRGQIATALGLRAIFLRPPVEVSDSVMSVVCKMDGGLVSLIVDSIGDVVEMDDSQFEPTPNTVPTEVHRFIKGIYKMQETLLSVIDIEVLSRELSTNGLEIPSGRNA